MHDHLSENLVGRYPKLYRDLKRKNPQSPMFWGFQISDGWFPIVDELSAFVTTRCPKAKAVQVKEKFGTLRFYLSGEDNECDGAASLAEAVSATVCEQTGRAGRLLCLGGWYTTIAPDVTAEEVSEDTLKRLRKALSEDAKRERPWPRIVHEGGGIKLSLPAEWADSNPQEAERKADIMRRMGDVRLDGIPAGWRSIVDALVGRLCRRDVIRSGEPCSLRSVSLGEDGQLHVEAEGVDGSDAGAIAMAAKLTARTDRISGAMALPPLPAAAAAPAPTVSV